MRAAELFFRRVTKTETCWLISGYGNAYGYGYCFDATRGGLMSAHRWSYLHHKGAIGPGLHVCHTCDNRRCVNPDHLFLGTNLDNWKDAIAKGRMPKVKLNPEKVREIRAHKASGLMLKEIAAMYGVTLGSVWHITSGRSWKWVA